MLGETEHSRFCTRRPYRISFTALPVVPCERCPARFGISEGPQDFFVCSPEAYPRPCSLEPCLAVIEINPGPALAAERLATGVAFPPPLHGRRQIDHRGLITDPKKR